MASADFPRTPTDFFAYATDNVREWLSPMHSWVTTRSIKPRVGDSFLSRFRRPMLDLVEDGAGGMHDMMIAACDQARYEQFGFVGPHGSCSENLRSAMARQGHQIDVVPQPPASHGRGQRMGKRHSGDGDICPEGDAEQRSQETADAKPDDTGGGAGKDCDNEESREKHHLPKQQVAMNGSTSIHPS